MSRGLKFGLGAGVLSIGAATMALVGTGTFASFTGQVKYNETVTAGDFHLQAAHVTDPITDPNATSWPQGFQLATDAATIRTVNGTSVVTVTQPTADPAATYRYTFYAYDSGTLPGQITTVKYTPTSATNTLMSHALITVLEHKSTGSFNTARTTANTTGFSALTNVGYPASLTVPPPPFAATGSYTFSHRSTSGNGLNGFLQPNTLTTTTGIPKSESQGWIEYRVIVSFTTANITNAAENQHFKFQITFTGRNT